MTPPTPMKVPGSPSTGPSPTGGPAPGRGEGARFGVDPLPTRPPRVVVLSHPGLLPASLLEALRESAPYELKVFGEWDEPSSRADPFDGAQAGPGVMVFTGFHVAMEHPLLVWARDQPEVFKVLVMEHEEGSLLALAVTLCGLDAFCLAPVDPADLRVTLLRGLTPSPLRRAFVALMQQFTTVRAAHDRLAERVSAIAEANVRAMELVAEVRAKNNIIAHKNRVLEQMAQHIVAPSGATPDHQTYFQGNLGELSVIDVLQLLSLSRKSATVSLSQDDRRALVVFESGQMIDASLGSSRGEEAVYECLGWSRGTFAVEPTASPGERTISQSTEAVLLDIVRRMDEQQARKDAR